MKALRFIIYLFKHGTLSIKPVNHEARRAVILGSDIRPTKPNTLYTRFIYFLLQIPYIGIITSNLAFTKNYKSNLRQFFFTDALALCYIRIYKSGSTSVLRALLPFMVPTLDSSIYTDSQIDELGHSLVSRKTEQALESYSYFTLVRNPFHRLVSVYLDLLHPTNTFFSYQSYFFGIIKKDMTFTDFIKVISIIPPPLRSPHFASQYAIMEACGNIKNIKYFRLEKDMTALKLYLDSYNLSIAHSNKHSQDYDYRTYYTKETIQLVYAEYKKDIELFHYEDEYHALLDYVNVSV